MIKHYFFQITRFSIIFTFSIVSKQPVLYQDNIDVLRTLIQKKKKKRKKYERSIHPIITNNPVASTFPGMIQKEREFSTAHVRVLYILLYIL